MKKWEYAQVTIGPEQTPDAKPIPYYSMNFEGLLNHYGEDGWEFVAGFGTNTEGFTFLFKREKVAA